MPSLTHLSFYDYLIPDKVCLGALIHCKLLEVLAIVWPAQALSKIKPVELALRADPRFVVVGVCGMLKDDWERGARGGENHWVVAKEHVKSRVSGETDGEGSASSMYSPDPLTDLLTHTLCVESGGISW
ncbi:hypothetical protein B0H14DRAFT_2580546 [Mycena olivaceomarginata]|nr:hypothetical protein B0H14DRAFT_2580546 [Mycena olivaceomarginata]